MQKSSYMVGILQMLNSSALDQVLGTYHAITTAQEIPYNVRKCRLY